MKIGTLLLVNALVATAFGLGFLIAPAQVLSPYGVSLTVPGLFMCRLFGGALLGFGVASWLLRDSTDAASLRAFAIALAVSDVVSGAIAAWSVLSGNVNALGWSTVVLYALLGGGFGYYAATQPETSVARA